MRAGLLKGTSVYLSQVRPFLQHDTAEGAYLVVTYATLPIAYLYRTYLFQQGVPELPPAVLLCDLVRQQCRRTWTTDTQCTIFCRERYI